MKKKLDNIFLLIGLTAFVIMLFQLDLDQVRDGISRAGYCFPAVIVLWALLYILNTTAWGLIIRQTRHTANQSASQSQDSLGSIKVTSLQDSQKDSPLLSRHSGGREFSWLWLYKVTVSGFALNYATPGGLMGGEAYRIAQLQPKIGIERASSSVILYVMTHIFSHFWFWLLSALLFLGVYAMQSSVWIDVLMVAVIAFCVLAIWFFLKGYKAGVANRLARLFAHIPFIKKYVNAFIQSNSDKLDNIDRQIAALHAQNPRTFFCSVLLELVCRIVSSAEIMLVLIIMTPDVSFLDSMLILAFTSLFANMLFFLPLQLGGREGGFMLSVSGLSISAPAGVFVALIVRLRELVWTALGLLIIKIKD